jgi:hypothetical protein
MLEGIMVTGPFRLEWRGHLYFVRLILAMPAPEFFTKRFGTDARFQGGGEENRVSRARNAV